MVSLSRNPKVPMWMMQVALWVAASSFSCERFPRASATHRIRLPCTGSTDTLGLDVLMVVMCC